MPHVGPDGDALGSVLGLLHGLRLLYPGKRIDGVLAGHVPAIYLTLPGAETLVDLDDAEAISQRLLPRYDVAVSLDCGALERLGPGMPYFQQAGTSINMDHHISNAHFGQLNLVETDAGASGEVVARLLDYLGVDFSLPLAQCLYVTLLTDTGGFRFASTTPALMQLAARLLAIGVDPEATYKTIYENRPWAQARLFAEKVLAAEVERDGRLVWVSVSQADLARLGAADEHLEGLIDRLREIEGVTVAAVFRETKRGETKVSLRSNHRNLNVAQVLAAFGGGGHVMAAGATLPVALTEAPNILLPAVHAAVDALKPF